MKVQELLYPEEDSLNLVTDDSLLNIEKNRKLFSKKIKKITQYAKVKSAFKNVVLTRCKEDPF